MRKIAVMVLLSMLLVSVMQSVSLAVVDDGRSSRALGHAAKAADRAARGDNDGATAEAAQAALVIASTVATATATGAAVGSFVPVVGTAIGAGLGALAGWLLSD